MAEPELRNGRVLISTDLDLLAAPALAVVLPIVLGGPSGARSPAYVDAFRRSHPQSIPLLLGREEGVVKIGATDARERTLADSQFGSGTPVTWYLGLSTTTPNEDGTGFTEPSGGAYARVAVTNNATNFPAAATSSGVTTKVTGTDIVFTNPTGLWGQITYYGWYTVSSGGTPEYTAPLDTPVAVSSGNTPVKVAAGQLSMPFD
jgi:hypothetical protein